MSQLLRDELNVLHAELEKRWEEGENKLQEDDNWQKLEPEQRHEIRVAQQLTEKMKPTISVADEDEIMSTLEAMSISALKDRIAAMPGRYDTILFEAAKLLEPKAQKVTLSSKTLKTEEDVNAWLEQTKTLLLEKIQDGPVIV